MGALEDYENENVDAANQQTQAPTSNPNDFGALSQIPAPLAPEDVQSRKDMFNQASARLLQARQQMEAPYQGQDLGNLAYSAALAKSGGMPVATGYTEGLLAKAQGEQTQREAVQKYNQQKLGMDLQGSMAQILASPTMSDEDKIQSIYQMSALSGNAEGGKNAAAMMRAMHTGIAGRATAVWDPKTQTTKIMSTKDAIEQGLGPVQRDAQGNIINQGASNGNFTPQQTQSAFGVTPNKTTTNLDTQEIKDLESRLKDVNVSDLQQSHKTIMDILSRNSQIGAATPQSTLGAVAAGLIPGNPMGAMSLDDTKLLQAEGGKLVGAAMKDTKNIRNLREFNAVTAQAQIGGGNQTSAVSQANSLLAKPLLDKQMLNFKRQYMAKYGTLTGSDDIWDAYAQENPPVIRDQTGNITGINEDALKPETWSKYLNNAPQIFKVIRSGQGAAAGATGAAPPSQGIQIDPAVAIQHAKDAIQRGASPVAIKQRLKAMNIDTSGF